jgi:hypothetical protein
MNGRGREPGKRAIRTGEKRHRVALRDGRTVVELIVALPILAMGGAAVTGLVLTAGAFLHEGERRLNTAMAGPALLDSLAAMPQDPDAAPSMSGVVRVMDRSLRWEWDGHERLTLTSEAPEDGGAPAWILERSTQGQPLLNEGKGGVDATSP